MSKPASAIEWVYPYINVPLSYSSKFVELHLFPFTIKLDPSLFHFFITPLALSVTLDQRTPSPLMTKLPSRIYIIIYLPTNFLPF